MITDDPYLKKLLSTIPLRTAKAESSFALYDQLIKQLPRLYVRFSKHVTRSGRIHRTNFDKGDAFRISMNRKSSALLLGNVTGDEVYSTMVILSYLNSNPSPNCNIIAIPKPFVEAGEVGPSPQLKSQLRKLVFDNKIKIGIIFRDNAPYFDGFHISILSGRTITAFEENLVGYLLLRGHQIGKYSPKTDAPLYSIIVVKSEWLSFLTSLGLSCYGFHVGEDLGAGLDALRFIFEEHLVLP